MPFTTQGHSTGRSGSPSRSTIFDISHRVHPRIPANRFVPTKIASCRFSYRLFTAPTEALSPCLYQTQTQTRTTKERPSPIQMQTRPEEAHHASTFELRVWRLSACGP
mmetsp:Transcript_89287/g.148375  ORF Transcript_89287/g.148375 Transcript_89287/m.148375 type:complete len:108 (-) Transcript_89287:49-372(-)